MLTYLHGDALGSASLATSVTGTVVNSLRYYPYGGTRSGSMATDRRYTGQRWEGSVGFYDYGARSYDPALGRFLQADSIVPNPANPQSLNRYAYVLNNPLKYTDPTGHWFETALDIASIGDDIYDISQNGLNWENGLSLGADIISFALPVVTGGGLMVRAATKADNVVRLAAAHSDEVADAIRIADHTKLLDAARGVLKEGVNVCYQRAALAGLDGHLYGKPRAVLQLLDQADMWHHAVLGYLDEAAGTVFVIDNSEELGRHFGSGIPLEEYLKNMGERAIFDSRDELDAAFDAGELSREVYLKSVAVADFPEITGIAVWDGLKGILK